MHPNYMMGKAGRYFNYYNDTDWPLTRPCCSLISKRNRTLITVTNMLALAHRQAFGTIGAGCDMDDFPRGSLRNLCVGGGVSFLCIRLAMGGGSCDRKHGCRNPDLKQPPFSYAGQHKYHSGQFRGMNMERSVYWEQLLIDSGLKEAQ